MNLDDALPGYSRSLSARGLSASTRKGRLQPILVARSKWGNIRIADISDRLVDSLFTDANWSPSTRNQYLAALRSFFSWCQSKKYLDKDTDLLHGWGNARVPEQEKLRIPVTRFGELLDACTHPRDRAVVALGLFAFLRGSEVQTLKVADYHRATSTLDIYRHKTKEHDTLPVCVELAVELDRWLDWYREDQGRVADHWFLVPSKNSPTPTSSDITNVRPLERLGHTYVPAQRAIGALGYPIKGEGEHTLRRSGARALFDSLRAQSIDGALLRVASMLGHKDVRVTQKYIGLNVEREQRNLALSGQPMFSDVLINADIATIFGSTTTGSNIPGLEMRKEPPKWGALDAQIATDGAVSHAKTFS